MIWDSNYPSDGIAAKTLDQPLRNTKVLIRERAVASDEHSFYGDLADGTHPPSQVGWVLIHDSLPTGTYPTGSLHYVKGDGLYVVDFDGSFQLMTTLDHSKLLIGTDDDHTQYYLKDSSRPMARELRMDVAVIEDSPATGDAHPMPGSHSQLSWWDAHGVNGEFLISRHFSDGYFSLANTLVHGADGGTGGYHWINFGIGLSEDSKYALYPACTWYGTMASGGPPQSSLVLYGSIYAGNARLAVWYGAISGYLGLADQRTVDQQSRAS